MDKYTLYPRWDENQEGYARRLHAVREGFNARFSSAEKQRMFSAPGRTEIGGNHTDHQRGHVLAAAVDMDVLGIAAKNGTNSIRIQSEGYDIIEIDSSDLQPRDEEKNTSRALIRGIASSLHDEGFAIGGFDAYMISSVLNGSGLSSSASFEVWVGTAMNYLFCDGSIEPAKIARIGQRAENTFFGKPSGLMDQTASALGGLVALDFKDDTHPGIDRISLSLAEHGHALCIIDTGADHADLTGEYAAIPQEMCAVAQYFGKEVLRDVPQADFLREIAHIRPKTGDRAVLRALHFYEDDRRAAQEAQCLKNDDFAGFLRLVNASGRSSQVYLQNIYPAGATQHQEVAIALAACELFLRGQGACRVHGGGFAGTVQAFVPLDILPEFKAGISGILGEGAVHELAIRDAGGVELTDWESLL